MLRDYANSAVDIDRVIKMLLIHDLCEIDAGDQIVCSNETVERKTEEKNGIKRILDMLPNDMGEEYLLLWKEFESGSTEDAKYAKAINRVPPLLHNINDDGHGWKKNKIPKEKVFDLNSERISTGSTELWEAIEEKLQGAVKSRALV